MREQSGLCAEEYLFLDRANRRTLPTVCEGALGLSTTRANSVSTHLLGSMMLLGQLYLPHNSCMVIELRTFASTLRWLFIL